MAQNSYNGGMSAFRDYYAKHLYKSGDGARLTQIDFLINDVIAEMSLKVDPTRWNDLLREKDLLEMERLDIVKRSGENKMAQ